MYLQYLRRQDPGIWRSHSRSCAAEVALVHYLVHIVGVKSVNVHDAKTHFSRLLGEVERGGEVIIARAGKPIARLVPHESRRPAPVFGADRGTVKVPEDFDVPLPDLAAAFEGRSP